MFKTVLEYLKYPSTYQGLTVLLSLAGIVISPEQQSSIAAVGAAVYGFIQVFFSDADVKPETKGKK